MERALISVPLNVAEGAYSRGRNRQARFQTAAASARETLACLETAEAMGFIGPIEPELGALFHRIIGHARSSDRTAPSSGHDRARSGTQQQTFAFATINRERHSRS